MKIGMRIGLCKIGLCLFGATAWAQDVQILKYQDVSGPENRQGQAKDSIRSAISIGGFSTMGGSFSIGGIDPNNSSALFGLLANESVRQELELSDAQFESANAIMRGSSQRLSDLVKSNVSEGKSMKTAGVKELVEELKLQAEEAIEEILLPSQMKRIRQLAYQIEIAQDGLAESLTSGRLGNDIGVVDNQKSALLEKAKQIEAQARLEVIAIRKAARARLFKELSTEQRNKAEELLGNYFEYEEPSLAQRIRQSGKKSVQLDRLKEKEPSRRKTQNP